MQVFQSNVYLFKKYNTNLYIDRSEEKGYVIKKSIFQFNVKLGQWPIGGSM